LKKKQKKGRRIKKTEGKERANRANPEVWNPAKWRGEEKGNTRREKKKFSQKTTKTNKGGRKNRIKKLKMGQKRPPKITQRSRRIVGQPRGTTRNSEKYMPKTILGRPEPKFQLYRGRGG